MDTVGGELSTFESQTEEVPLPVLQHLSSALALILCIIMRVTSNTFKSYCYINKLYLIWYIWSELEIELPARCFTRVRKVPELEDGQLVLFSTRYIGGLKRWDEGR